MGVEAKTSIGVSVTDGNVEKTVVRLAIPAVGEQILNASVAIVDTYLVGHLGAVELSAVGLANQYVLTATMLLTAVAVGCTALIARSIGSRDYTVARIGLGQSILLALGVGSFLGILGLLAAPVLMAALNASHDVIDPGAVFLRIVSLTMPLTALLFIGNACLRGAGDTAMPLRVMILVNGINIAVAWSLVDGVGPLPALGVLGVAIGAAVARGVGGLVVLWLFIRGHAGLQLSWATLKLQWAVLRRIVRVGIPAAAETLLLRFGQLIFVGVVSSLGTVAYAAHVIVLNAEAISYMPGLAFATAATTVVGQNLGANRPERASRGAIYAFMLGAGLMSLMGVVFAVFPGFVIGFFTSDPAVLAAGIPIMRIASTLQPGIAAQMVFAGALRGAGDTRWTLMTNGVALWLVRVFGGWVVVNVLGGGLTQVWSLLFFDFLARGGACFWRFRSGRWQTARV